MKKEEKENHSLAWEITSDYKKENKALKILLGISIIANVIIALILK